MYYLYNKHEIIKQEGDRMSTDAPYNCGKSRTLRIEKFYYNDSLKDQDAQLAARWKELRARLYDPGFMPSDESLEELIADVADDDAWDEHVKFDEEKYALFVALGKRSVSIAKTLEANLLVNTELDKGWISFVGFSLLAMDGVKEQLTNILLAADGIHITKSMDYGQGKPSDINDVPQLTCWFDLWKPVTEE